MAELIRAGNTAREVVAHAIFVHGLDGHPTGTWLPLPDAKTSWLEWLGDDIPGLAVWTVGYDAAHPRLRGHSSDLPARARDVLKTILDEPQLRTGVVTLIGHSLGGLLIKQLIRSADAKRHNGDEPTDFVGRVKRVAFLSTPHDGTDVLLRVHGLSIILKPSLGTSYLLRRDPHLGDLNEWYRGWSSDHGVANLVLIESQAVHLQYRLKLVVEPDDRDPGLGSTPIAVAANHLSICKPADRNAEVYVLVRKFIESSVQ